MAVSADTHATGQGYTRRNMNMVSNTTVMIHEYTSVQNDIITNLHAGIDHNPGHDRNTLAQHSCLRYDCGRMHHIYNHQTKPAEVFKDLRSRTVISDSSHPQENVSDPTSEKFRQDCLSSQYS